MDLGCRLRAPPRPRARGGARRRPSLRRRRPPQVRRRASSAARARSRAGPRRAHCSHSGRRDRAYALHVHGDARSARRACPARLGQALLGDLVAMARKTFTVGWLYPDLMNIYGDRGNILTLLKRAEWRDFDARLIELGRGITKGMEDVDVFFFGGGQDREQALVYEDLLEFKQPPLERAVAGGAGVLAVCGGYQLLGHYYQTAEGERFPGIGMIDVRTEAGKKRFIGDVVVDAEVETLTPKTLVGFENHSGRTFLGPKARPLGRVRLGN